MTPAHGLASHGLHGMLSCSPKMGSTPSTHGFHCAHTIYDCVQPFLCACRWRVFHELFLLPRSSLLGRTSHWLQSCAERLCVPWSSLHGHLKRAVFSLTHFVLLSFFFFFFLFFFMMSFQAISPWPGRWFYILSLSLPIIAVTTFLPC